MSKLSEILCDPRIPKYIKEKVNNLSDGGKEALNSMFDEDSDFFKHAFPTKIAKRFFADPAKYPILYHYTDINGLKGIISSKIFRIGSQYYMNDPEENIYTFKLAKNCLIKMGASDSEISFFDQDFHKVRFDPYVWSFTYNNYSQALQNYGDFALEFHNQELQENLVEQLNPGIESFEEMREGNSLVFPLKVEYNTQVQQEYISSVMSTYLNAYRNLWIDESDMYSIMEHCYRALTLFSLCFKNSLLYQEEEIRFVIFRISNDNKLHPDTMINKKPWVFFPFNNHLIHKIIYSRNINNLVEVKNLLINNKFNASLLESTKLPYGRKIN